MEQLLIVMRQLERFRVLIFLEYVVKSRLIVQNVAPVQMCFDRTKKLAKKQIQSHLNDMIRVYLY